MIALCRSGHDVWMRLTGPQAVFPGELKMNAKLTPGDQRKVRTIPCGASRPPGGKAGLRHSGAQLRWRCAGSALGKETWTISETATDGDCCGIRFRPAR